MNKPASLMKVRVECRGCSREFESVMPWYDGFHNGANFVRCANCDSINAVENMGEYK